MATTRCKPVMAAAIVIGVVLSASASAAAATVSVEAGVLSFSAGQGELNQVRIERVATFFRVRDDTAPLSTADADCTELDAHLTRCLAAPVDEVEVARTRPERRDHFHRGQAGDHLRGPGHRHDSER